MAKTDNIVDIFENKLRFKEYSDNTIRSYSYYLGLFLEHTNKRLSHITKKDSYAYLDLCSGMEHTAKNHTISAIKLFYKYVIGVILDDIRTERPRKKRSLPVVVDWMELERKFSNIKNIKHRCILELAARCALRVSEVINIKLSDVDASSNLILIRNSKFNKDRYVPVSDDMIMKLISYCEEHNPSEYLFEGQGGGRYAISSCQKIFKKYIDPDKSFHKLRHSGATQMVNNNTNLRVVQEILGHESSKTTEIYTHISKNRLVEAAL